MLDDLLEAPEPDAIAVAARAVADGVYDPLQHAGGSGETLCGGCVRCRQDTHLADGWFCRPCRLFMTEVDDVDPVRERTIRREPRHGSNHMRQRVLRVDFSFVREQIEQLSRHLAEFFVEDSEHCERVITEFLWGFQEPEQVAATRIEEPSIPYYPPTLSSETDHTEDLEAGVEAGYYERIYNDAGEVCGYATTSLRSNAVCCDEPLPTLTDDGTELTPIELVGWRYNDDVE